jgi:hypothetical protein
MILFLPCSGCLFYRVYADYSTKSSTFKKEMRPESKIFSSSQPESPIADHRARRESPYARLKRKRNSVICGLFVRWFAGFFPSMRNKKQDP